MTRCSLMRTCTLRSVLTVLLFLLPMIDSLISGGAVEILNGASLFD